MGRATVGIPPLLLRPSKPKRPCDVLSLGLFRFLPPTARQRTSRCRHEEMRRESRLDDPHAIPSSFSTVEKSGGPAGQTP